MATGGGRAGTGYIEIRPELVSDFSQSLQREADKKVKPVDVPVEPDTEGGGQKLADGIGKWDAAMMGGLAGLAAIGGKFFVDTFMMSLDNEASADRIGATLGLSEASAQQLGRLAGQTHAQGFGEGVQEVGAAQASAIQNALVDPFTQSEAEVHAVTSQLMVLADLMGVSVPQAAEAAGQMMRNGMAKDSQEAFDILARGMQTGANRSEDLIDTFREYSPLFKQLGLEGTMAMGLVSQSMQAGARNSDIAADALKEFAIRAQDGSKLTGDSFTALGLDAKQMSADIAAGGPTATAALDLTLDRLRQVEDPLLRAQIAVGLFGTQAEDTQAALYAMDPSTAVDAMGQVGGAAEQMTSQVGSNARAEMDSTWANIQLNAANAWTRLRTDFGGSMEDIVIGSHETVMTIGGHFARLLGEIPGWIGGAWENIEGLLGRIPEGVGAIFEGLEAILVEPWKAAFNTVAGTWNALGIPEIGPFHFSLPFGKSFDAGPWGPFDFPDIPTFDTGGIVPGAIGSSQLILAHGGETVLPTHKPGGGMAGGVTVNQTINTVASPSEVAQVSTALLMRRIRPR